MEKRELSVELRSGVGKGIAKKLRTEEKVPAIFYGPHMESPVSLAMSVKEFSNVRQAGGNVLLTLKTASQTPVSGKMALMKDYQVHPVSRRPLHVDLYEVRMDEEIKVSVKVVLVGKAAGVGEGGILQQVSRELEVRCLPANVPDRIEADVSALNVGESLHVSDIKLPQGVKVVGQVDYTLAAVVAPEEEKVESQVPTSADVPATAQAVTGTPGAAAAGADGAKAGAAPAKEGDKKAEAKKPEAKKAEGK